MRPLDDSVGTVTFGDITVRRLGYGAARLSSVRNAEGKRDRELGRVVCRHVLDVGVNFIDVAALYGAGECEEIVAESLHPYPDDLLIASKTGLVVRQMGERHGIATDCSPETIRAECEKSLARLRRDVIDVYQIHTVDPQVPWAESVGAFKALRDEGKIRHVGISNVSVAQLDEARAIVPIVSVQNEYNVAVRHSEDVLDACVARGIPFIPYNPNHLDGTPAAPVADAVAAAHGVSRQQVAVRWLLDHSPLNAPIPGTTQPAHVDDNVAAAWLELTDDDRARLDAVAPPP
jgi:aryl-alcohol dehydrogenase-like predicted oxidoreductase